MEHLAEPAMNRCLYGFFDFHKFMSQTVNVQVTSCELLPVILMHSPNLRNTSLFDRSLEFPLIMGTLGVSSFSVPIVSTSTAVFTSVSLVTFSGCVGHFSQNHFSSDLHMMS